ncbi:winged helix-turn-helix transcriptional regulator [Streptomyces sp. NPDC054962]
MLLLTNVLQPSAEVLPALGLLLHQVRVAPAEEPALVDAPGADVILIDGRRDLPRVRSLCQLLRATGPGCPLILVVTEGGLAAITAEWGIDDVVLDTAGPAEIEVRLRLAMSRQQFVNEVTSFAKLGGGDLDLTFNEFKLLKYLAQRPGRVFTRVQLLQEVWGSDNFGGTDTVDVHVRRLRAKLRPEHASLIATVRDIGYCFGTPQKIKQDREDPQPRPGENSDQEIAAADAGVLLDRAPQTAS